MHCSLHITPLHAPSFSSKNNQMLILQFCSIAQLECAVFFAPLCPNELFSIRSLPSLKKTIFPQPKKTFFFSFQVVIPSRCSVLPRQQAQLSHTHIAYAQLQNTSSCKCRRPLFASASRFSDNHHSPPQRPPNKPSRPGKPSKQLPPQPNNLESDEVNQL